MKTLYLAGASVAMLAAAPALAQNQSVSMSGITVDYSGDVDGDGSFSGATVDVSGSFSGDLEISGAAVEADVEVGEDVEASGGAVDISGSIMRNAEISGGAVDINLIVGGRSEISGGAVDISSGSVFSGDVEISAGALDFDGHARAGLDINFGAMDFYGRADQAVDLRGNSNEGWFRRRDRSELDIAGILDGGGEVCAHEVRFLEGAEVNRPLTVLADDEPIYADGFDTSNITFIDRDGERCRD